MSEAFDRCSSASASAVGLWILLLYNHAVWGGWTIFGGYADPALASGHAIAEFGVGIVGIFVSPERGVLVMTPALLLAAARLPRSVAGRAMVGAVGDGVGPCVRHRADLGQPILAAETASTPTAPRWRG